MSDEANDVTGPAPSCGCDASRTEDATPRHRERNKRKTTRPKRFRARVANQTRHTQKKSSSTLRLRRPPSFRGELKKNKRKTTPTARRRHTHTHTHTHRVVRMNSQSGLP